MTAVAAFVSVRTEGGLLPSDLLARVAALDPTLDELTPAGYHLLPGERLGEAITRSWNRLVGAWAAFQGAAEGSRERTGRRWLLALFAELGYGQLQVAKPVEVDDRQYPVSHGWGHVPIHLVPAAAGLDTRTAGVAGAARMSPHALVQELLNRSDDHLWGFVSNGLRLRVMRDNAALTRQAFVDFDLEAMFAGQVYADFAVLWLVCHQSRVEGEPPEKCVLEQWSADAAKQGARALDQLRNGVETAISQLGAGFLTHPANKALKETLRSGVLDRQDYYRQLLRLVYRLLFVLVAEARDLLLDPAANPADKARYRSWYSVDRIRTLAESSRGGAHPDLWRQLQIVFAALGSPTGQPALALPGLGSYLWSDRATPDLDQTDLSNRALLAAVRALTSIRDDKERVRRTVDYRNLGSEELGSVYESLLELHPSLDAATGAFSLTTAGGNERKTTGSYYTPSNLIAELLDSALEPVVEEAIRSSDPEAAILNLTVLDPACGSGHFLIAAAHRIARRLAATRSREDEASPTEIRRALRDVVGRCLHGVDLNEMAVELCKVSLWMEAMEPGKPLTFLESKIVHGNSLLGATPRLLAEGVPDGAFKALEGDESALVILLKKRNKQERTGQGALLFGRRPESPLPAIAAEMAAIDEMPTNSLAQVHAKEERWIAFQHSSEVGRSQLAADVWCASFVCHKARGTPVITDAFVRQAATHDRSVLDPVIVDEVLRLREEYGFLHLHLAFPDVFRVPEPPERMNARTGWAGGFDIVLGNPPWDHVEFTEREWFAARSPEIANAKTGAARKRSISELSRTDPALDKEFRTALRHSDAERHLLTDSGRYPLCGRGRVNTYAVFAENIKAALAPPGSAGIVVPSGIATDDTTKMFFAEIVEEQSIVSLFDFVNDAGLFPGVGHGRQKFCLLTMTGAARTTPVVRFVFFASMPSDLREANRQIELSPKDLVLLNPNTRTCPVFRTVRDAVLTKTAYEHHPILLRERPPANPWSVSFRQGLFNMTSDSGLFKSAEALEAGGYTLNGNTYVSRDGQRYLPLYEGKMFWHFDHRFGDYAMRAAGSQDSELPTVPRALLVDPAYVPTPLHWVSADEVQQRAGDNSWFLAFRDVTNANSERTFVTTAIPAVAVGNNAPLLSARDQGRPLLLANLSSFCFDFVARQKINAAHANFFIVKQLPIIAPAVFESVTPWGGPELLSQFLRDRVLELVYTAHDLGGFAKEVGYSGEPFVWHEERRLLLRAELDASFFHLYGIDRGEVDYIMETFTIVKRKELGKCGEFLSKRLIVARYDAMAEAIRSGKPYRTVLDPPPAHPSLAHPEASRPRWA